MLLGCSAVPGRVFCRPLNAPVSASVKILGWLTIAAVSGAASGTLMTSMRHCVGSPDVTGSVVERGVLAARELQRRPDARRARVVDVDVVGVVGVGHERVRVRTATGLHARQLHGVVDVADVEDAHAAEAIGVHRTGSALGAAVDPAARLLDRHEEQVAVHRHVTLAAGAHERRPQRRSRGIRDVVDLEAVEVADDGVVTGERQVGVHEAEVAGGRVERCHAREARQQLDVARRRHRIEVARREVDAGVVFCGGRGGRQQRRAEQQCSGGREPPSAPAYGSV